MPKKKKSPKKKKPVYKKSKTVSAKRASSSESENETNLELEKTRETENLSVKTEVADDDNNPNTSELGEASSHVKKESKTELSAYIDYLDQQTNKDAEEPVEVQEKKNFSFLVRLLKNVGTDVLRRYFLKIHPSWSDTTLDATTLDKGCLKIEKHEETVFKTGNTEKWDESLLIKVLLYSKQSSRVLKKQPDHTKALQEVRQIRNRIVAHASSARLEIPDFNTNWNLLKNSLVVLGATENEVDSSLDDYTKLVGEQHTSELVAELHRQVFLGEEKNKCSDVKNNDGEVVSVKPSIPTWNTWQEFSAFVYNFNPERSHFVLLVDEMPQEDLKNFMVLSSIPWNLVLDFNPSSEDDGFYKEYTSLGSFQLLVSPWTPGQISKASGALLSKEIDRQRTQWLFVNGRKEDTEGCQPRQFSEWERFSKREISRFFACCSEEDKFDNHKSITCIILKVNEKSHPYVDVTLQRLKEFFNKFKIFFCCFQKIFYEKLSIAEEVHEFLLTSNQIKQGVESVFHTISDISSYRMPTSQASVPVSLTPRDFAYLSEHLQLFYDGCENETFDMEDEEQRDNIEEQHRRSFLSGNVISPASLYFNHDAKRDIEDDIQAYVQRMLSQPASRSSIVSIQHSPGTGGSTIARRILWNLRKSFPCVIVKFPTLPDYDESDITFTRKVCERISVLEEECGIPILVLVDSFVRSGDILGTTHRIMRNLNTLGKKSVILECLYTNHGTGTESSESSSYKVFYVDSRLESYPADLRRFKSIYKEYISAVETATRVFHFPLLSMVKEFRPKLEEIVLSTLDKLDDTEKEVVALVAFVHLYAGQSTPAILIYGAFMFRLGIKTSPSEPVTYDNIKDQFSDELLNLMVRQNPRKRADSPSQCLEMYTLQHIEVSNLVFQKHLDYKRQSLLMYVDGFLDLKLSRLDKLLTLYCDLLLYYKAGDRELKFSLLFSELTKQDDAKTAEIFCKAAKLVADSRIYGHAARYHAKMRKQNFDKAKDLLKVGLDICKSRRRVQGIQDTKGIILLIELKSKIRENMIETIDDLQQSAEMAVNAFREARDFPPTFHSPLIGEVEVWLLCIEWIINHSCKGDAEEGIRFIHSLAPPFFRTCIGDSFTLLDRVDEMTRSLENIHDPEKAQEHSQRVRWNLVMTTRPKRNTFQNTRHVVENICEALLGGKNLPSNSGKQVKRYRAWTLLSLFRDQQLDKPEDLDYLLRLLEDMVFNEKDYAFARHLLRICPQINGHRNYDVIKAMKVCQHWLKAEEYDPLPYFYGMVIAFIQIINGHGPSGYYSIYHEMVKKLNEKAQSHCRRTDATYYLGKNNEGMSQLVSRARLRFTGQDHQTDDSEVVRDFWKKDSRQKLKECVGRVRVSTQGKHKITKVELLQGGGIQLYVKKNSSLGTPGKDFDKDTKVYFVVSFNLTGAVANGITFEPVEEKSE